MIWKKTIKCKFCKEKFEASEEDICYSDLRNPIFFIPDYQYYIVCPECNENIILTSLHTEAAIRVQERINNA